MTARTTSGTVTFTQPFKLTGMDGAQAAGSFRLEIDEELIEELSFPVYRRTATYIVLPGQAGSMILAQTLKIDPAELEAALKRETMPVAGNRPD
jgi:hypothetical protein